VGRKHTYLVSIYFLRSPWHLFCPS